MDAYRFNLCYHQVGEGSILDVGAYLGDFLKLAQNDKREIFGTEINEKRVNLVNSVLEADVVKLDFRNGNLCQFEDSSVDNVVCMETVEHVIDDRHAISELCRVARKRVIITVPFRENLQQVLCMHCDQYTPHFGHQHSYDRGSFLNLIPSTWKVNLEKSFAKRLTRIAAQLIPESRMMVPVLRVLDNIIPGDGKWVLIVLEKKD
ncbi:MAG: class I SAM-dependent methyltransferase [Candidatus Marinimicrobia bacterium]|nr:class I SAM-dependent methyltransferase [Candidatus Neomarinimicrobiota bacterium]